MSILRNYNEFLNNREKIFNEFFLPDMSKAVKLFNEIVSWLKENYENMFVFEKFNEKHTVKEYINIIKIEYIEKINKYPADVREEIIDYLSAYIIMYFIVLVYIIPYHSIHTSLLERAFKINGLYSRVVNGLVSKLKKIHSYSLIYLYYIFEKDTEFAKKIEREIILRPPREIDVDIFDEIFSPKIYKLVREKYNLDGFDCYYYIDRHPDYDVLEDHIRQGKLNYIFIPRLADNTGRYLHLDNLIDKYKLNIMNENELHPYVDIE